MKPGHRRNPAQPAARLEERAVDRFLSPDERKRLEAALAKGASIKPNHPGYIQPDAMWAIRLLALTGMRHSEVCDLKWDQVDWNRGILRLPDSKTGMRDIVVADAVIALLREIAAAKNQPKRGRVVCSRTGDKLHSLGRTWRRLRELAGMPDLRHSVASDAIMQGAPPRLPPPPETQAPSRVAIKAEYIPEIQRAAQILRPSPAANCEEMLIGTVEILSGVVGPDGRRSGEVQFSVFLPDSDPLRVRANLDPEQYADAVRAHESGRAYVRLHGVFHRGQRVGRIDPLRALQLLDEQAASGSSPW